MRPLTELMVAVAMLAFAYLWVSADRYLSNQDMLFFLAFVVGGICLGRHAFKRLRGTTSHDRDSGGRS